MTTSAAQSGRPAQATSWRSQRWADGWRAPRFQSPGLQHDDDGQREGGEPEEEVRHHRQWVQVERDRDPAHRDLSDRDEERAERRPTRVAREPFDPPGAEPGRQREHDPDQRNHAVAELDERVEALLGIRLRAAARPVLAAEPRPGEAHEGAGRDDEEERDARCERETHERPRRERSRTDRRDRHRYSSTTPEPSSIRPMRAMKRPSAANVARRTAARSFGIETSSPPAVCGS